jgi:hypothetical protein
MDPRVSAGEQRFEQVRRTLRRLKGRGPTRLYGLGDISDRPTDQVGPAERQQAQNSAAASQRLADTMQEQEVLRAGEDELPRLVLPVDDPLDVGEQVGHPLDLVQDHLAPKLIQESARVVHGERPRVGVFERRVAMAGKGGPHERGLAGLAWSRDGHNGIVPGRSLESS